MRSILILIGGPSPESQISEISGRTTYEIVHNHYQTCIYRITKTGSLSAYDTQKDIKIKPYQQNQQITTTYNSQTFLWSFEKTLARVVAENKITNIIMMTHGRPGEDGILQEVIEKHDIPYTGGTPDFLKTTISKSQTKKHLDSHQIKTPGGVVISRQAWSDDKESWLEACKTYPGGVIVKPDSAGSSVGLGGPVTYRDDIVACVENAFKYDDTIVVEPNIHGEEYTCGMFRQRGDLVLLPVIWKQKQQRLLDFNLKYLDKSKISSRICEDGGALQNEMHGIMENINMSFQSLSYCRVDFIWNETESKTYTLEINAMPFISPTSSFVRGLNHLNITAMDFFETLLNESES